MAILRKMPPWRKALLVAEGWDLAKALAIAGLRPRFPEASSAELRSHVLRAVLGDEAYERAYASCEGQER